MAKLIRHQGEIYVEAAQAHNKCAKGTHWNVKSKKCEKLPPRLASANSKANRHTKSVSLLHPSRIGNTAWKKEHVKGVKLHTKAMMLAQKHNFPTLVEHHALKAKSHRRRAG